MPDRAHLLFLFLSSVGGGVWSRVSLFSLLNYSTWVDKGKGRRVEGKRGQRLKVAHLATGRTQQQGKGSNLQLVTRLKVDQLMCKNIIIGTSIASD